MERQLLWNSCSVILACLSRVKKLFYSSLNLVTAESELHVPQPCEAVPWRKWSTAPYHRTMNRCSLLSADVILIANLSCFYTPLVHHLLINC